MIRHFWLLFFLYFIVSMPLDTQGQRWKRYRHEVFAGVGVSNFLGELGGGEEEGRDFYDDLDFNATRPTFAVGYRYKLLSVVSLRGSLIYGRVNGNDANTEEFFRNNRNLHFRSPIVEVAAAAEVYFLKENLSSKYKLRGVRGKLASNLSGYFFVGVGGFYFNPRAEYNGKWVSLQPLGTEGQGLREGTKKYSRIALAIPGGIGFKYTINKTWSLGIEYGLRKTSTDYIDDVSTTYYDNAALRVENGDMAADLADPSKTFAEGDKLYITGDGTQRGDSNDKDSYMFGFITLQYRFSQSKSNRPKF